MTLVLIDDNNDLEIVVRENVTYTIDYNVKGEVSDIKINCGNGVTLDLGHYEEEKQEKMYTLKTLVVAPFRGK